MIYALVPLLIVALVFSLYFLYLVVTEYKPEAKEDAIKFKNSRDSNLDELKTITSFNIGHCALDKEQEFYVKGGTNPKKNSKEKTFDNLISITHILEELDSDFYLLQEVDEHGSRSANINQIDHLTTELTDHNAFFAYNYQTKAIPINLIPSMGNGYSGLLTMSKKQVLTSRRFSLNGQEFFPKSMFYLKRCITVTEIQIKKAKKLYLINIHLASYDKEKMFRTKQITSTIDFISELYDPKENYVIVGGDFNLLLDKKGYKDTMPSSIGVLPQELYDSQFRVAFDNKVNTVRSGEQPYVKGRNFETVIDGFLVSHNVTVSKVETHDFGFKYSDHNPVTLSFKLK